MTIFINFLLLAWVVFIMVKVINRLRSLHTASSAAEKTDDKPAPEPENIKLLREIRDELKAKNS